MFSAEDFKITISSIEFSIFYQENGLICPNCGHELESNTFSEVKLSSLLLLIGVGSYVCYKLMIKKKKRKEESLDYQNLMDSQNDEQFYQSFNTSRNGQFIEKHNNTTSTPFINFFKNFNKSPSICSSGASELLLNLSDFVEGNDSSLVMPSFHSIGNNTVAKLDQLLDQIQDIKKSVFEIDEQIFDVKESNVKFDSKLFSLAPEMSSSLNTDSDLNERFNYFNTEPQTPTLEWDLNDLNAQNNDNNDNNDNNFENDLISSFTSSYLKHNLEISNNPFIKLESLQDLSSPSISTSGEFSITSSSEQTNSDNSVAIQKLIAEANKMGILNDLMDVLVKKSKLKRDSAYFED